MSKNTDRLKKKIEMLEKINRTYPATSEFRKVAMDALVNFLKRVRRGIDYETAPFKALSESYIKTRKTFKNSLDPSTKPTKSNATATGEMLRSMDVQMQPRGFILFFRSTTRVKQLTRRIFKKVSGKAKKSLGIKKGGSFFLASYGGINKRTDLAGHSAPKDITNAEVAEHYNQRRNLLGFSQPEIERIVRRVKQDIIKLIKESK